mgnify:FL=1
MYNVEHNTDEQISSDNQDMTISMTSTTDESKKDKKRTDFMQ